MSECLFCDMVSGEQEATIYAKTETETVFKDIDGLSNHTLAIPNEHIENAKHLNRHHVPLLQSMLSSRHMGLPIIIKNNNLAVAHVNSYPHPPSKMTAKSIFCKIFVFLLMLTRIGPPCPGLIFYGGFYAI